MFFFIFTILFSIELNVYAKPTIGDYPIKAVAALEGATYDLKSNTTFSISGVVKFVQYEYDGPVDVNISISGLPIGYGGMKHGFHVHTLGINNTSDNFTISIVNKQS
jgi:Cu/Zn superoxide dismutase